MLTIPSAPGRAAHEDSILARAREYARHKRGRQAYAGMLHRLDRGTSGALAIALSPAVHAAGRQLFAAHRFHRTYLAIVEGAPAADSGVIDRPIGAEYRDGRRDVIAPGDETLPARTRYRVVERFGRRAALVELTLDTGRQHRFASTSPRSAIPCWTIASTAAREAARPPIGAAARRDPGLPHPLTGAHRRGGAAAARHQRSRACAIAPGQVPGRQLAAQHAAPSATRCPCAPTGREPRRSPAR